MRKLEQKKFREGEWWSLLRGRDPLVLAFNFLICSLSMLMPFPEIKNPLLRLTGMKVGESAFIAMGVALDVFFPEKITIGDRAVVGYGAVITAHELLPNIIRKGDVRIGKGAMIGTRCVVLPGVEIGQGACVSAMSLVNRDVPAGSLYGGVPARKLR